MATRGAAMVETIRKHRFTAEEFHRMGEAGIFGEDDRVELLDGEILVMAPIGLRHQACVDRLNALFSDLRGRAIVRVQGPVRLDRHSEPLPDVILLAPREDFYASRPADPGDVLLLVEVSETTLAFDRGRKLRRYALTGVSEYWIVDLVADRIEIHRGPAGGTYREKHTVERGGAVAPSALPGFEVAADEVLP